MGCHEGLRKLAVGRIRIAAGTGVACGEEMDATREGRKVGVPSRGRRSVTACVEGRRGSSNRWRVSSAETRDSVRDTGGRDDDDEETTTTRRSEAGEVETVAK